MRILVHEPTDNCHFPLAGKSSTQVYDGVPVDVKPGRHVNVVVLPIVVAGVGVSAFSRVGAVAGSQYTGITGFE